MTITEDEDALPWLLGLGDADGVQVPAVAEVEVPWWERPYGIAPALPVTGWRRWLDPAAWFLRPITRGDDWGKANARRSYGIQAFVGVNGGGKSLAAVATVMPSLAAGRRVLSTVRLLDFEQPGPCPGGELCDDPDGHEVQRVVLEQNPENRYLVIPRLEATGRVHAAAHPYYVPLRTMGQILDWRDGDLLLDEVQGIAGSRTYDALPPEIQTLFLQMRRRDVRVVWTTPHWSRADIILRQVTTIVTVCSGGAPQKRTSVDGTRSWSDRRYFRWETYDSAALDQWEAGTIEKAEPLLVQRVWRPKASIGNAYDTLDAVSAVGVANDSGACLHCGGGRTRRKCSCPADHGGAGGRGAAVGR